MFKIYSVSWAGMVREREAIGETEHTYALRDGSHVKKSSDGDMWRTELTDAYRVRIADHDAATDALRQRLEAHESRVTALRAKLAEVEG